MVSQRKQSRFQFFSNTLNSRISDSNFNLIIVGGYDPKGGINKDVCEVLSRQEKLCNVFVD